MTGPVRTNEEVPNAESVWCSCAHNSDGSVTTILCPLHADEDPCWTKARVTGKRRRCSVVRGLCSACGWSANRPDWAIERSLEALRVAGVAEWDCDRGDDGGSVWTVRVAQNDSSES